MNNLPRTTQKLNSAAAMSDGFNKDVNVVGYAHPQRDGLSSGVPVTIRSRDKRATQPQSTRSTGMSKASAAPSIPKSPTRAIDLDGDEDSVKAVEQANGSIIQRTVGTPTSDIQEPSNNSPAMKVGDTVQKQVVAQDRPQMTANTARPRQARLPHVEMLGGVSGAETQSGGQLKRVARRPAPDMDRSHVGTVQVRSDDSDSGDSNAGYKSSSKSRKQDKSGACTPEQKLKGSQNMGRLVLFRDAWSHTLDMEDTYVWFIREQNCFQIHVKGTDTSYYADVSNINKYYAGGNEPTAKTVVVEGPTIHVGKPKPIAYWAAFIFSDHADLVGFRLKLNEVIQRSSSDTHKYAITDKTE